MAQLSVLVPKKDGDMMDVWKLEDDSSIEIGPFQVWGCFCMHLVQMCANLSKKKLHVVLLEKQNEHEQSEAACATPVCIQLHIPTVWQAGCV